MTEGDQRANIALLLIGLGLVFATTLLDLVAPCAWWDIGCKGGRFLLFSITALLGFALVGVGIFGAAKTASAGASTARAGVGIARSGAKYVRKKHRAYKRRRRG